MSEKPAKFAGVVIDDSGVNILLFPPGSDHATLMPLTLEDVDKVVSGLSQWLVGRVLAHARSVAGIPLPPSAVRR